MPDGNLGSQGHGLAFIRMDDGAVLDVETVAQIDPIAVPAQHAIEPNARAAAEAHGADHTGVGRDVVLLARRLDPPLAQAVNHALPPDSAPINRLPRSASAP